MQKIAILGGGIGALTAAVELTNDAQWADKYEITVYQLGWRLGGKGASGRNLQDSKQIEEHGLHLWMGCYENAFNLIRNVYSECSRLNLMPETPFPQAQDAFTPLNLTAMMDNAGDAWQPWAINWQPFPGVFPGDPALFANCATAPSPSEFFLKVLERLADYVAQSVELDARFSSLEALVDPVLTRSGIDDALALARTMAHGSGADSLEGIALTGMLTGFRAAVALMTAPFGYYLSAALRHADMVVDVGTSIAIGMIADVTASGFDNIENQDFTAWLTSHGCKYAACTLPVGMYDACFAYRGGTDRSFGAGSMLYASLRLMFTYEGAIMWWMNAGMGDVVAAPVYLLLKTRGVKFEFFQKVTSLGLSADKQSIETINISVQATPVDAANGYNPLTTIDGIPCWPDKPFYDQLNEGARMQRPDLSNPDIESWWTDLAPVDARTLQSGEDFDIVVLGISLGALQYISRDLIAADAGWAAMVNNIGSVKTQSLQLWLNKSAAELGWQYGKGVMCSYVEPHDTWSDLSHLLKFEHWPPEKQVTQIAYFCNSLAEGAPAPPFAANPLYPAGEKARVEALATEFIANNLTPVWPSFDPAAIVSRYCRANIDPSERYVLSLPGTKQYRLPSGDSGFANLFLAGDWTLTEFSIGCVEAAVISGRMASQSICGSPAWIYSRSGTGA